MTEQAIAIVGVVIGLLGAWNVLQGVKISANKAHSDQLHALLDQLQEQARTYERRWRESEEHIDRLRTRLADYATKQSESEKRICQLEARQKEFDKGVKKLIAQVTDLGAYPVWHPNEIKETR